MRVLQLDTERGFRGGQRQLMLLCQGLGRYDVQFSVALQAGSALERACLDHGYEVVPVRQRGAWDPRAVTAVLRELKRQPYDLIHAHASHAHTAAVGALRAAAGPPLLVSRRVDFPVGRPPFNRFKYGNRVARFLAVSDAVGAVLRAGGVAPQQISVVHEGVDPLPPPNRSREALRQELGVDERTTLLFTAMALVDHKDPLTAVRALSATQGPVHLAIAGEGALRAAVERCIHDLGAGNRVTLLGQRDDVPDLLRAADVFLLSSQLEGLCTSLMDAGMARLPTVATSAGGIAEVVEDGRTGILVPPRDADSLARAIDRLAGDPALRAKMGRAACERVGHHFTTDRMVDDTVRVYREVAGR